MIRAHPLWLPLVLLSSLALRLDAACVVHEDMLGPFYISGAPQRDGGIVCVPAAGDRAITVYGTVRSKDCAGVVPFAVLDVWQASTDGDGARYYGCSGCNGDETKHPHGKFYCRGKVKAGADGRFTFQTVRPGRYQQRPIVHVHVKVLPAGEPAAGPEHVTQLYFTDDDGSASMPNSVRMSVAADSTASIDIATPFAASQAGAQTAAATSPSGQTPAVSSAAGLAVGIKVLAALALLVACQTAHRA
jgi:protocatechuate 3,4-dioxygenase beta subunit